ncbi:putative secreted protein [Wickerhamomyces ciferrii]|uniref:Secreted protein n=1 Tax=Wickerhamomyces ciferrii (strain ATCC 14091 / BCRC 22168 / CBS 111 / JCM 3599 / NBRC 0793 / NRRL Y-1031 F-60-10) TaxID=1206466 RepID=K0KNP7_WICCF|nr:uncharacterized protein BN7_4185 [Wickerhamomyces ciferrii]CCH44616.1 putative secreted protein [Wickerhamomyces ciferrii]
MKLIDTFSHLLLYGGCALAGSFNILTFNVAGLPQALQGNGIPIDKDIATEHIGKAFKDLKDDLDVIHVQEDFHYNDILYKYDNHPYRSQTSGDVPIGSGLNTLSNFPFSISIEINGIIEGAIVNFINLHSDAGTKDQDNDARNKNLQQVANYIDQFLHDEAVIIFGDFNSRYYYPPDNIEVFRLQNGLKNPWVDLERNGIEPIKGQPVPKCSLPATNNSCEVVDKVFYRGSKTIELKAEDFRYADDLFTYEGHQLSDHNPILTNFSYTLSQDFKNSNYSGGFYGAYFNDLGQISKGVKTTRLSFKGNVGLDLVSLTLDDGTSFNHGGNGGLLKELELQQDEYWTKSYLCKREVDNELKNVYINGTTSLGSTIEAGSPTNDCQYFEAPDGYQITGFFGQGDDSVNLLGFIYSKIES